MLFTDPRELGGLHVVGRNDVTFGVVQDAMSPANRLN